VDLKPYRSSERVRELSERIRKDCPPRQLNIMEVCGTHTMAIARHALRGRDRHLR
jgi:hydrogenase maturation factor